LVSSISWTIVLHIVLINIVLSFLFFLVLSVRGVFLKISFVLLLISVYVFASKSRSNCQILGLLCMCYYVILAEILS
jgi:hypothetical protein